MRLGSKAGHEKRTEVLTRDYPDPDSLRRLAGEIKQHALDHLDLYLERAQARLEANGAKDRGRPRPGRASCAHPLVRGTLER